MQKPHIAAILIAASPQAPMRHVNNAHAVPGRGLEGDRYFTGTGTFSPVPHKADYELTLIESEKIADFARRSGLSFNAESARRNIVTAGVDLNALVGRDFALGPVRLRGIRLCEPCDHLASITHREVLGGLVHQAGLRAQIISEGVLHVGDEFVAI